MLRERHRVNGSMHLIVPLVYCTVGLMVVPFSLTALQMWKVDNTIAIDRKIEASARWRPEETCV